MLVPIVAAENAVLGLLNSYWAGAQRFMRLETISGTYAVFVRKLLESKGKRSINRN